MIPAEGAWKGSPFHDTREEFESENAVGSPGGFRHTEEIIFRVGRETRGTLELQRFDFNAQHAIIVSRQKKYFIVRNV